VLRRLQEHGYFSSYNLVGKFLSIPEVTVRGRPALPREKFNQRMGMMKKTVLKGSRQGWYEFQENILRGYVRLRAEEQGVTLDADHPLLSGRSMTGENS
jgi:hypothetical protein